MSDTKDKKMFVFAGIKIIGSEQDILHFLYAIKNMDKDPEEMLNNALINTAKFDNSELGNLLENHDLSEQGQMKFNFKE